MWGCVTYVETATTLTPAQSRKQCSGVIIIPFLSALVSSQLKSVWLLHVDTALKRNTKQREGVQQSASKILVTWRNCFFSAWATEGQPRCYLQPAKGAQRWAEQVSSHQHTARHEASTKTHNMENPNRTQGKKFTNKNVQARGWNHPLWNFSKLTWPWPTCSNCEVCAVYSREQGQVIPSGPYQPKFLTNMLHNPQYHATHAGPTTCSVIKTRFAQKQPNYSHMLHILSVF